jgi:hypothetical protein
MLKQKLELDQKINLLRRPIHASPWIPDFFLG